MRASLIVLCLFLVTACDRDSPTAPGPVDHELTLAPGQTASVPGTSLQLTFVSVTGDSRCPADANCITGGSASVRVDLAGAAGTRRPITFETGDLKPVSHGSITIELVQLAPYPFSTHPIDPADYRATVRVKR